MGFNWFQSRKRGNGRRGGLLRALGPSWSASPLRRTVQVVSLCIYLWLFLYVTWPYTSRQAQSWPGWIPVSVDRATGRVLVASDGSLSGPAVGHLIFAADSSSTEDSGLGRFRIAAAERGELTLDPADALGPEQKDRLAVSVGPWRLQEAEPGAWPSHYADNLVSKEILPAELFLVLDPLVSMSAALASWNWIRPLWFVGAILLVSLFFPRGFCGYLCPLGTSIDAMDASVGKHFRLRGGIPGRGWTRLRYFVLAAVLISAAGGVVLTGFVAAIPLLTRGLAFVATPLQTAAVRGWHQVPALAADQWFSIALLVGVFALSLLGPRFWCRCLCPTGAVFSIASLLRINERKLSTDCVGCGKCAEACSFGAIGDDFSTRPADCAFCQTCGGLCPVEAITFGPRSLRRDKTPTTAARQAVEAGLPRRSFLAAGVGVAAAVAGAVAVAAAVRNGRAHGGSSGTTPLVRPPGSMPEAEFLQRCVRCGQCLQACPNDVLQPSPLSQGFEGLWTPRVAADWSGCEPSCNNCGQVCPTGAIRALPLEEKRAARMGLAVVDLKTCLPYAGTSECRLCIDECAAAGYDAIEFLRVGTQLDSEGRPLAESGFLAPVVLRQHCVGCGLCQTRCYGMNVVEKRLLAHSAIVVEAGEGKEDRLAHGSYIALRNAEQRRPEPAGENAPDDDYLPDFLK